MGPLERDGLWFKEGFDHGSAVFQQAVPASVVQNFRDPRLNFRDSSGMRPWNIMEPDSSRTSFYPDSLHGPSIGELH